MDNFEESWGWFAGSVYELACKKGWWPEGNSRSFLECMGLVISELGEAVEAFRSPRCSAKILGHSHAAEELADVIIRLADLSKHFDLDISESNWFIENEEIFDACSVGNDEDNFVYCIDVLIQAHHTILLKGNPVERIAIVAHHLGEAITSYCTELHDGDTIDAMAQAVLEICALAQEQNIDLGEAIVAKHTYNQSRTYRHGAKLY